MPYGTSVCSVCGAGSKRGKPLVVLWTILLVIVGLPAALFGGCLLLINGFSPPTSSTGAWLLLGLIGVALPVFFIVMLVRETRK